MRTAILSLALTLTCVSAAQAQIVYVQSPPPVFVAPPPPIVPVVSYSFYPPAPVVYAPQPTVAYYPPAVVAPSYGVYSAQTTTYGLGIFRPRQVVTQYYYTPVYPR